MGCCGEKRAALRKEPLPPQAPAVRPAPGPAPPVVQAGRQHVAIRYLERSPILVRGPVTGREYTFSGAHPDQAVDTRDAPALLKTRFFRRVY